MQGDEKTGEKLEQKPEERREEKPMGKPKPGAVDLLDEAMDAFAGKVVGLIGKGGGGSQPLIVLPPGVTPLCEEAGVRGEKVNYKVALNPEVFYLYMIFRMEAERRGRKWDGTSTSYKWPRRMYWPFTGFTAQISTSEVEA